MEEEIMTQKQLVLKYIEDYGSITMFEAFRDLGITKCNTIVSYLRRDGYKIKGEWETSRNRYGKPVRYMRYSFEL